MATSAEYADVDVCLVETLQQVSQQRRDYWAFDGKAARQYCHNYFQYPAMMVPAMLGSLIATIVKTDTQSHTVYDPFAGAGTVLTESMLLGRNFVGHDVNPLAILLCKAKSGPFRNEFLATVADDLIARICDDRSCRIETDLPNRNKWFQQSVAIDLSRIRRAIRSVNALWC